MARTKTKKFDVLVFSKGTREQAELQLSILNNQVWAMACNWGAKRYGLTVQDVEDQMQWTLNKIWNKREIFTEAPNVTGFMYKVLGWRCLQFIQRRRGLLSTVEALLDEESYYSNSYEHKNFTKAAIEHISMRQPLWGKVLYMYYVNGLEGQEINLLTGIPIPTVHHIRKKSIDILRAWYGNDEKSEYILPPANLWGKLASAVYEKKVRVPRPIHTPRIQMRPFEEAHAFVLALGLKSLKEWEDYCHSEHRPKDIPMTPSHVYQEEFRANCPNGISDWLGYHTSYASYEEVEKFMREKMVPIGVITGIQWIDRYDELKSRGVIPATIPKMVDQFYKGKGFTAWGVMTGINRYVKRKKEEILPYKLAKKYVQETLVPLGITTLSSYKENGDLIPIFLPPDPIKFYGKKYLGPEDFFGIKTRRSVYSPSWPYEKARQWVINNLVNSKWEIDTSSRWMNYIAGKYPKAPKLPSEIPRDPRYYKKNGAQWVDWNHWFGTSPEERQEEKTEHEKAIADKIYEMRNKKFLPFRKIAKELKIAEKRAEKLYSKYVHEDEQILGYIRTPLIPKEEQEEIYRLHYEEDISRAELARIYNVSIGFVQNILEGKSVKEIKIVRMKKEAV